jgi:hypothetical protein
MSSSTTEITENLKMPSSPKSSESRMEVELSKPSMLQTAIILLFIFVVLLILPWMLENRLKIGFTLAAIITFMLVPYPVHWFSQKYWSGLEEKKRLECENRLASIVFNLTTGIPAYLGWWELFPGKIQNIFLYSH